MGIIYLKVVFGGTLTRRKNKSCNKFGENLMHCSKIAAFEAALEPLPPTKPGIWTSKQEERIGQEKGEQGVRWA